MKPTWILQHDIFREGNPPLMRDIIRSKGMECFYIGVTPFDPDGFSFEISDALGTRTAMLTKSRMPPTSACVVAYGSMELCKRLEGTWTPTTWTNLEALRCWTYFEKWWPYILQQSHHIFPWSEIRANWETEYDNHAEDSCLFFKPDANLKLFNGQVVARNDFLDFAKKLEDYKCIPPDELVVVAAPQNIEREWRFLIRNGKVVTGSLYKVRGETKLSETWGDALEPKAVELAEKIAADPWQPQSIYTMDVCETKAGHFRLIEIGDANASGYYRCDLEKVVDAMSEQALQDWEKDME